MKVYSVIPAFLACMSVSAIAQEIKSGIEWQAPPIVTPGQTDDAPPSDATVLFDGTDLSAWEGGNWKVADGVVYSGGGDLRTKEAFGDIQLHIEWSAPSEVKGSGQGRGNSGVYLMEKYEVQVLDSYDNETYFDGQAGSVYKQTPPMVNAMRKPGEWNTYDIFFTAPTFKVNGDLKTPAYVTLIHNGVLALNHFELLGPSSYTELPQYEVHDPTGKIKIQDHGNPVRFRNIWLREIKPAVGVRTSAPYKLLGGEKVTLKEYEVRQKQKAEERKRKAEAAEKARKEKASAEKETSDAAAAKDKNKDTLKSDNVLTDQKLEKSIPKPAPNE